jgi:DNA helicase HerA-like ATPase
LSKGKIGQDNANLLGALLVSRIQFYALQRAKIPNEKRRPFYLYVDEFQNFATGSFEEILSESRKYKLGLNLTHQFTGQLPEDLLKAVYGNVGTIITFALGAPDAKELAKEFAPYFSEEDIISLERFQVYMKLMVDGMTSHPFSAKILVPWDDEFLIKKTGNKEKVLQRSREKYGVPREKVESKVNKWLSTRFDKGMAIAQEYSGKNINGSIGNNFESTEEK